jgi:hypothetical protein
MILLNISMEVFYFSSEVDINIFRIAFLSMLGGSLVTTAWRVLRLRMEGTASRYGG